jgi:cytochrome c biogenesis protein CcdA
MHLAISFSPTELERLYLTYQHNAKNYAEIKHLVLGKEERLSFVDGLRGRLLFVLATALIATVSSIFSYFSDHIDSLVAIWLIWLGIVVVFSVWTFLQYQTSHKIWLRNRQFFDEFERAAKQSPNLQAFQQGDFYRAWQQKMTNNL